MRCPICQHNPNIFISALAPQSWRITHCLTCGLYGHIEIPENTINCYDWIDESVYVLEREFIYHPNGLADFSQRWIFLTNSINFNTFVDTIILICESDMPSPV